MGHLGWQHEFRERSWPELLDFHAPIWAKAPEGQYLVHIIESVIASGRSDDLPVTSSMLDLVVVGRPVPDPPMDVLFVRAPGSLHRPKKGYVLIEYEAVSGRDTRIERPVADAVKLFWRLVAEKFGIESGTRTNDT